MPGSFWGEKNLENFWSFEIFIGGEFVAVGSDPCPTQRQLNLIKALQVIEMEQTLELTSDCLGQCVSKEAGISMKSSNNLASAGYGSSP